MSLIKIYRTPTATNERLPAEQQNGYHGFATEQFIEGAIGPTGARTHDEVKQRLHNKQGVPHPPRSAI